MIYELRWTEARRKEMWMEMVSTGDDNYEMRWTVQRSGGSLLIGVIAGQFVLHILPHLAGVDGFHYVVPFFFGEFANKVKDRGINTDHGAAVDE